MVEEAVASISFSVEHFRLFIKSDGTYGITVDDLPWSLTEQSLPGLLEYGRLEVLNDTWLARGREPRELIGTSELMPCLTDPRLEECAKTYLHMHLEELQQRHAEACQKWRQMQKHPLDVGGTPIRPGQAVRIYYSPDGTRAIAVSKGDATFFYFGGYGGNTLYLSTGSFSLTSGSSRYWLEPVE